MAEAMAVVAAARGLSDDTNVSAIRALVSYLVMEADIAEDRARRLRDQAEAMARRFGISAIASSETYGEFGTWHFTSRGERPSNVVVMGNE